MPKYSAKKEAERNDPSLAKTTDEVMKWEIAKELGLYDKVIENGWKSLSAKESGRIGGILAGRKSRQ
jgi:hypothetical protein